MTANTTSRGIYRIKNAATQRKPGPAQILLHWLVLGFVALQYLLHEPISESFEKRLEGAEGATSGLVALHIFGGTLILVLMMALIEIIYYFDIFQDFKHLIEPK